jgi:TonB family protein
MKIGAAPLVVVCCALLLAACASGGGAPEPQPAAAVPASGPVDTARVYDIDAVTVKPRLINTAVVTRALEQNYTPTLRDAGAKGMVQVEMTIERNGHTTGISVLRTNDAAFNIPAMNVVRAMRFTPAQVRGIPVRVRTSLPVSFEMQ